MDYFAISLLVLTLTTGVIYAEDTNCTEIKSCVFQTSDNSVIDLTQLKEPISSQRDVFLFEYFQFDPCKAFKCESPDDALLCRDTFRGKVLIPEGNNPTCKADGKNVALTYKHGDVTAEVKLRCVINGTTKLDHKFTFQRHYYALTLSSPFACKQEYTTTPYSTTTPTKRTTTPTKRTTTPTKKTTTPTKRTTTPTKKTTTPTKRTTTPTKRTTTPTKKTTTPTKRTTTPTKKTTTPTKKTTTPTKRTTTPTKRTTHTTVSTTSTTGDASRLTSVLSFSLMAIFILSLGRIVK